MPDASLRLRIRTRRPVLAKAAKPFNTFCFLLNRKRACREWSHDLRRKRLRADRQGVEISRIAFVTLQNRPLRVSWIGAPGRVGTGETKALELSFLREHPDHFLHPYGFRCCFHPALLFSSSNQGPQQRGCPLPCKLLARFQKGRSRPWTGGGRNRSSCVKSVDCSEPSFLKREHQGRGAP